MFDCLFRRLPLGLRLNQNNLRVIGFNQELYEKQFLGKNVIRVGDVIVSVDNVTVRNAKELSKQIRTPLRIRFVRTNKSKIPKSYYMISPDRVVFFVPMMTSPLGLRLGKDGCISVRLHFFYTQQRQQQQQQHRVSTTNGKDIEFEITST